MRKLVQFVEKKALGVKMYRHGQKAVIQGGLADVLESQGVLLILETVKETPPKAAEAPPKAAEAPKEDKPKKVKKEE